MSKARVNPRRRPVTQADMGRPIYESNHGGKKFAVDESGLTYPVETRDNNSQSNYAQGSYEPGSGYSPLIPASFKVIIITIFLISGFIGSCVPLETRQKIEDMFSMEKIEGIFPKIQDMINEKLNETLRKLRDTLNQNKVEGQ